MGKETGPVGDVELIRFESQTPNLPGRHVGVFGLANGPARSGRLSSPDWGWWRASDDWCNAAHLDPSAVDDFGS